MKTCLLLLMFLLRFSLYSSPTIWHVNHAATGANTGLSWQDAFIDMQNAIAVAQYGDHIWVAKGTYVPAQDGNREVSFVLNNGVKWYGGFAGGEISLNERDWELNETILSGEIGNPDSLSDNSLHVVYVQEADSTTSVDGFFILKGYAKPDANTSQGFYSNLGGGVFINGYLAEFEVQLVISNCQIENNFSNNGGGGLFLFTGNDVNGKLASPKFLNLNFINNHSFTNSGGLGFGNTGGGGNRRPEIINCIFLNNSAIFYGGAIGYGYGNSSKALLLKNCTFLSNYAGTAGGACLLVPKYLSLPIDIVACSFISNETSNSSGATGSAIFASPQQTKVSLRIKDCMFEGNEGKNGTITINGQNSNLEMDRCFFEKNVTFPSGYGSLISLVQGRLIARNCVFEKNFGNSNNSVFELGTHFTEGLDFINCSFLDHYGIGSGYLFRLNYSGINGVYPDGPLRFLNCIFQNNRNPSSDFPLFVSKTDAVIELDHCLINEPSFANCQEMLDLTPVFGGLGEIFCNEGMLYNTDALFVSEVDEDYHLQPCSPLRNAGFNIPWDTLPPQPDLQGNARIQEGVVDIGPYEVGAVALWADSIQPVSCPGYNDGVVWLQGENACGPAQYTINGGSLPTLPASNLAPGEYVFTVTDALNRTDTFSVTLEAPVPVTASASVLDASGLTAADGQIWLDSIEGGAPPYALLWSNGATSDTLTGLLPGIYTLTVTDSLDCAAMFEWELGFVKSVEEVSGKVVFHFWPNPAENTLWIRFHLDQATPVRLQLSDLSGKVVWQQEESCSPGNHVWKAPLDKLPPGIYFAGLNQSVFRFVKN